MRRVYLIIGLIVLLIAAGFGGYFLASVINPTPPPMSVDGSIESGPPPATATPINFVEVVVAVQEIPRGFRIPANAVTLRPWPAESAPFNAIMDVDDVTGKIARTDIFREQPILSNMVVDDYANLGNDLAQVGSDAAAILPRSMVAVTLHVPAENMTQGIMAGDRVDLIYTLPTAANDEEEAAPTAYVTQRMIQDALVVWLGEMPADGRLINRAPTPTPVPSGDVAPGGIFGANGGATPNPPAAVAPFTTGGVVPVTLAVTPQDASVIVWAKQSALPVTVVLRSATDVSQVPVESVTLDYVLREYDVRLR